MGRTAAVWSPVKKTGKTLFLYILTRHLRSILPKDYKILLLCVNLNYGNLMDLFGVTKSEFNFEDLVNLKLYPDDRFDMLKALSERDNLYFVASNRASVAYINRNMKIFEELMEEFRDTFDLVLVDTISGFENPLTNMILEKCDHVINVVTQDKANLDHEPFVTGKELASVVNLYRDIFPSVKDISSLYGLKNLFTLPICDNLQEMKNRDKLEFYLQHDTEYNNRMKDICRHLASTLEPGFDRGSAVEEKRRKTILNSILGL